MSKAYMPNLGHLHPRVTINEQLEVLTSHSCEQDFFFCKKPVQ